MIWMVLLSLLLALLCYAAMRSGKTLPSILAWIACLALCLLSLALRFSPGETAAFLLPSVLILLHGSGKEETP
ncbi:MAG: hypothetical protein IJ229_01890 [Clostridia bacterium]|nr:hypothetical protein [Clostridia bacterium]MBR1685509.1 hypothetical protein [Clostridia bacterium]